MRCIALILAAFFSVAAAVPPPPLALEPYIRDGRFDPGDYGWMRGRLPDASAADKAASAAIGRWLDSCHEAGLAETRAELREMGIADPKLERSAMRDPLCAQVAHAPSGLQARTWAEFQQAIGAARPVAETYLMAVRLAERIGGPRGPSLADALLARSLGEQMLRAGLSWGEGDMKDAPALAPDAAAIVRTRIGAAMTRLDRANTEWLKGVVAKQGWPKISEVGERASQQAWLLVQHADADPAFQLQALRLMEPLTAAGEVSKRNHAYLHDRVMLKLAGKQRYATQAMCRGGKRLPQPLEDEAAVARLRAEAGLDPLPGYLAQLDATFGACAPDRPTAPPPAK